MLCGTSSSFSMRRTFSAHSGSSKGIDAFGDYLPLVDHNDIRPVHTDDDRRLAACVGLVPMIDRRIRVPTQ
jgi:hypothetical protein